MTVLAMHQPNFLPWCGFFEKIRQSDIFVLLDDVQVPRGGSYANRTRILTPGGVQWLTLPVYAKGKNSYDKTLVVDPPISLEKTEKTIRQNYENAEHFDPYYFEFIRGMNFQTLSEICSAFILEVYLCFLFEPGTNGANLVLQSDTGISSNKSTLALDLCKHFGADVYLSGTGAKSYNNPAQFEQSGIELRYLDYKEQPYQQLWTDEFVPGLSVIDRLFNTGTIC